MSRHSFTALLIIKKLVVLGPTEACLEEPIREYTTAPSPALYTPYWAGTPIIILYAIDYGIIIIDRITPLTIVLNMSTVFKSFSYSGQIRIEGSNRVSALLLFIVFSSFRDDFILLNNHFLFSYKF